MTHRQVAEYMAERLGGWTSAEHRRQYVEDLVVALDDRRYNKCRCNEEGPRAVDAA